MVLGRINLADAQVEMAQQYAERYAALAALPPEEMGAAIAQIQKDVAEAGAKLVTERDAEVTAHNTKLDGEGTVVRDKMRAGADILFNKAFNAEILKLATTDTRLSRLSITVDIDRSEPDENGDVVITVKVPGVVVHTKGTTSKATSNGGAGRGVKVTVDGKEYTSGRAAHDAFFPASTSQMNMASIVKKLTGAGHTVS